jgi:hypothetical protein
MLARQEPCAGSIPAASTSGLGVSSRLYANTHDAGSDETQQRRRRSLQLPRCPVLGSGTPPPLEAKCDREPPEDDRSPDGAPSVPTSEPLEVAD